MVWTIIHDDYGTGYTVDVPDIFEAELEMELDGCNEKVKYTEEDTKTFIDKVLKMKLGEMLKLQPWT